MNDKIYNLLLLLAALVVPLVCGGIVYALVTDATEAFNHFGFLNFLTSSEWRYTEGAETYGALPFVVGTLLTTLLALLFCSPFSLPVALFVGEYFRGTKLAAVLSTVTDLLAGIPSILLEPIQPETQQKFIVFKRKIEKPMLNSRRQRRRKERDYGER